MKIKLLHRQTANNEERNRRRRKTQKSCLEMVNEPRNGREIDTHNH